MSDANLSAHIKLLHVAIVITRPRRSIDAENVMRELRAERSRRSGYVEVPR